MNPQRACNASHTSPIPLLLTRQESETRASPEALGQLLCHTHSNTWKQTCRHVRRQRKEKEENVHTDLSNCRAGSGREGLESQILQSPGSRSIINSRLLGLQGEFKASLNNFKILPPNANPKRAKKMASWKT